MAEPLLVLVTWPHYDPDHPDQGGALCAAGCALRLAPKLGARRPEELAALAIDAAAIVSTDPFTAAVLAGAPGLQVIAQVGVGTDSIDTDAAARHGVAVTTTPGANEAAVADHTLALMLGWLRRIPEHDAAVRAGRWDRTGPHAPRQLAGSCVGLVGFGAIGRLVAQRLLAFGVTVVAHDPAGVDHHRVTPAPLPELLRRADIVSLHVPLTDATRHLIGATELAQMAPHAVLVNTSRGAVVDEPALVRALHTGGIAGAALDVFEDEPPAGSPLLAMPNVVLTPHTGGLSTVSVAEMTRRATASVIEVLRERGCTP